MPSGDSSPRHTAVRIAPGVFAPMCSAAARALSHLPAVTDHLPDHAKGIESR